MTHIWLVPREGVKLATRGLFTLDEDEHSTGEHYVSDDTLSETASHVKRASDHLCISTNVFNRFYTAFDLVCFSKIGRS